MLALSANGVALTAVIVTGVTALVATIGGWVFQVWTVRRQFENARTATDLDDLRTLLDDGGESLRRYLGALEPLEAAYDALVQTAAGVGAAAADAFGQHEAGELDDAFNAAYRISVRLEIRLGSEDVVVVRYRDALGLIQNTRVFVDQQLSTHGTAEIPAQLGRQARYAANRAYLEAARTLVGSSLGGLPASKAPRSANQQQLSS